jgi:fructose-bisphosphate aldolase class II
MAAAIRKVGAQNKTEFDPRQFLKPAMAALKSLCRERFEAFGTAGNAARITATPLPAMAKLYANGGLDPVFSQRRAA